MVGCHPTGGSPWSLRFYGTNQEYFSAYGGPISFNILPGDLPTWSNDQGARGNPWFVQYFYPVDATLGPFDQFEQGIQTSLIAAQPGATTVTWTIGTNLSAGTAGLVNVQPSSLNLFPKGPGLNTVSCLYNVNWVDHSDRASGPLNQTVTASGGDDTTVTKDLYNGVYYSRSNQIHAHKPQTMLFVQSASLQYPNPLPFGTTSWETDYQLTLQDQDGTGLPDVYFNEYFPLPQPTGDISPPAPYAINDSDHPWLSLQPDGIAAIPDHILKNWEGDSANWAPYSSYHEYRAATRAVDASAIKVGAATIHASPGSPNNSPTPVFAKSN